MKKYLYSIITSVRKHASNHNGTRVTNVELGAQMPISSFYGSVVQETTHMAKDFSTKNPDHYT